MPELFTGEHSLLTAIMVIVLLGAFLTISLVMLWAPSHPFPGHKEAADQPRPSDSPQKKRAKTPRKR